MAPQINTSAPRRVAFAHDWLVKMRGGEKCLEALCELFPDAEIFTLVHKGGALSPAIEGRPIHTSILQRFPRATERYQRYLPLYPLATECLSLRDVDCVVSISAAVAKSVRTSEETLHVCYCNTPMRYLWDQYEQYFGPGKAGVATRAAMALLKRPLRWWDRATSSRPDHFIANSENVRERIERIYGRQSEVIYPPVETGRFSLSTRNDGYYLVVSALVPYKRIDLAVRVASTMGERLIVVGEGQEFARLRAAAGPTVEFLGWRSDEEIAQLYAGCMAVLFPGEEDFGIVPVEAMACGKPVVAYARGGALETVVERPELRTGVLFTEQTTDALENALRRLRETKFEPAQMRQFALSFDREVYKSRMRDSILRSWAAFARRSPQVLK